MRPKDQASTHCGTWLHCSDQRSPHVNRKSGYTFDHTSATVLPVNGELMRRGRFWGQVNRNVLNDLRAAVHERGRGEQPDYGPKLTHCDDNDPVELRRGQRGFRGDRG